MGGDEGDQDDEVVVLTVAASRFEAELIAARLRSGGLHVMLGPDGALQPQIQDNTIAVWRRDLEAANALLASDGDPS